MGNHYNTSWVLHHYSSEIVDNLTVTNSLSWFVVKMPSLGENYLLFYI